MKLLLIKPAYASTPDTRALKNLQKAAVAGGAIAIAVAALVAVALFFMQGSRQVAPALGIDGVDNNNDDDNKDAGDGSNNNTGDSAGANNPADKATAATNLECHSEDSPLPVETTKTVAVSAKLADKSSGRGIPGKQVMFTILPGNPVATSSTDALGQASISLNSSEFKDGKLALFIFFDGDRGYDFSSCRIDIAVAAAPQVQADEPAANN